MPAFFFWKSKLQTSLLTICAHLLTWFSVQWTWYPKGLQGKIKTKLEGGCKSWGAIFEVYFSKKRMQAYLFLFRKSVHAHLLLSGKVCRHFCSLSEKECRCICSLPENDTGISVSPWKRMQANLDPTYTLKRYLSPQDFEVYEPW